MGEMIASSAPMWEPGTTHGYHGLTWGFVASQLLTRADPQKRTLGAFFRDEVSGPFGKHILYGVTALGRTVRGAVHGGPIFVIYTFTKINTHCRVKFFLSNTLYVILTMYTRFDLNVCC